MQPNPFGKFLIHRLKERSTWRGLILALASLGVTLDPALSEAIIALGLAAVGLAEMLLPDPSGKMQ